MAVNAMINSSDWS